MKNPQSATQESLFVIWKIPTLRYADQGFLSHRGKEHRLENYANGQAARRLTVTPSRIFSGVLCMSAREFNLRYLSPLSPGAPGGSFGEKVCLWRSGASP